jgi:hypothetical protein
MSNPEESKGGTSLPENLMAEISRHGKYELF